MSRFIYLFLQVSWGILQNAAGFLLYLANGSAIRFRHKRAYVTVWNRPDNMALGMFIFVAPDCADSNFMLDHEYGHTLQSVILGPLWLLLIALPSLTWNRLIYPGRPRTNEEYYRFFPEKWANRLGRRK